MDICDELDTGEYAAGTDAGLAGAAGAAGRGDGAAGAAGRGDMTSSTVMYNFGVGPRFAYVSASARAPK